MEKDNNSFILFYSNYCKHCKDFLVKLRELDRDLFNKFRKICVDTNDRIPESIKTVPTIITPTHNHALTDNSVFIWLDTMASQFIDNKRNDAQTVNTHLEGNDTPEGISPFIKNEMGGNFSDNFSFLGSEGPLAHSFSFLENKNHNLLDKQINQENNINFLERNTDVKPDNNMGTAFGQLEFQNIDRPEISQKVSNNFETDLDSLKNNRDSDPYIRQAPQRR